MIVDRLPAGDLVGGLPDVSLNAVLAGQFALHAQPIRGGSEPWHELLLRPHDGTSPALLVAYAHQLGRAAELDRLVFAHALRLIRARRGSWSINVSSATLAHPQAPAQLLQLLQRSSVPASSLVLEVLEAPRSLATVVVDQCLQGVAQLRSVGIRIALDDLSFWPHPLPRSSAHILKVDREPVQLLRSPEHHRIAAQCIRSVVHSGAAAGAIVVAEGVETDEDLAAVADLGVKHWQGWLFGKPQPVEELPW